METVIKKVISIFDIPDDVLESLEGSSHISQGLTNCYLPHIIVEDNALSQWFLDTYIDIQQGDEVLVFID